jgi:hypothetical protein
MHESYEELKKFHRDFNEALKNGDLSKMLDATIATAEHAVKVQEQKGVKTMAKTKEMIHPAHAEVWFEMAIKVNRVLRGMNFDDQRDVSDILQEIKTRLNDTGYQIISDYTPGKYEYLDFDIFREDRYGIRIFLGRACFDEKYFHGLDTMYLYAPNDVDDVLDDVTIDDIREVIENELLK